MQIAMIEMMLSVGPIPEAVEVPDNMPVIPGL